MIQLHYLQLKILQNLLFVEEASLSEIRPTEDIENNKLLFHIDSLMRHGLVKKNDQHKYFLTTQGKEYANTIDTDRSKVQKQGKISTIQCCYKVVDDQFYFLIYTRKKHPFYGSQGFPSGKVPWGSSTKESSARELKEETNLDGEPTLFYIEHHLVKNSEDELIEDKYFYFYRFLAPQGELINNNEGLFEWVAEKDLRNYLIKPFENIESILRYVEAIKHEDAPIEFHEYAYSVENF